MNNNSNGGIGSNDNNLFKALLCEDCIKKHREVIKAEEGY